MPASHQKLCDVSPQLTCCDPCRDAGCDSIWAHFLSSWTFTWTSLRVINHTAWIHVFWSEGSQRPADVSAVADFVLKFVRIIWVSENHHISICIYSHPAVGLDLGQQTEISPDPDICGLRCWVTVSSLMTKKNMCNTLIYKSVSTKLSCFVIKCVRHLLPPLIYYIFRE